MGILEVLALIRDALQFPGEVRKLINTLKSTPVEEHQAIMARIQKQRETSEETGRPQWD